MDHGHGHDHGEGHGHGHDHGDGEDHDRAHRPDVPESSQTVSPGPSGTVSPTVREDRAQPAGEATPHGHDHEHDHGHEHEHEHGDGHAHGGLWGELRHLVQPHSHDAADSVDDALVASNEGVRAVQLSLIGLGLTAVLQLVVALTSGSVAVLADTIHNFADASTAVPLWLAFSVGRKPANTRYTYGYGRAEDLAGVFVLLMIVASAAVAFWESLQKLLRPE